MPSLGLRGSMLCVRSPPSRLTSAPSLRAPRHRTEDWAFLSQRVPGTCRDSGAQAGRISALPQPQTRGSVPDAPGAFVNCVWRRSRRRIAASPRRYRLSSVSRGTPPIGGHRSEWICALAWVRASTSGATVRHGTIPIDRVRQRRPHRVVSRETLVAASSPDVRAEASFGRIVIARAGVGTQ